MLRLFIACCATLFVLPAHAWNGAGHRIVALIAWQQLNPQTKETIAPLLAAHPDYPRWLVGYSGPDATRQAFLEASTWPDDIRSDPRFYDEERDPPTLPQPGLSDTRRHRHWHYVDFDNDAHTAGNGELDRQLERLSSLFLTPDTSLADKAYALPWIIHLVADLHQPLHVGRHEDEGGNRFAIEDPENPRLPQSNLHRWWDDLPGAPWLRGRYLEARALSLLQAQTAPVQGNVTLWRNESRHLTESAVYPPTALLTPDFRKQAQAISNRRLVEGGWRLGRWLNSLLVPRETASE